MRPLAHVAEGRISLEVMTMAKPSGDYAISELVDIAQRYIKAYKTVQRDSIEEYGSDNVKYALKALENTTDQDYRRIEYLRTIIEERNNDHDHAEPTDTASAAAAAITAAATAAAKSAADAAASAAVAAAAAAAHFVRYDGTGADEQA